MGFERSGEIDVAAPSSPARRKLIGIDPGATKCGYAVAYDNGERVALEIVPTADMAERIDRDVRAGGVDAICIGDATTSASMVRMCRTLWPQLRIVLVDERNTTFEARRAYYDENPPRGILKFIPRGMLVPNVALDGYAAWLIIERYRLGRTQL